MKCEGSDFEKCSPLSASDLAELFDWLLGDGWEECDHTFRRTTQFLRKKGLRAAEVIPWLQQQGGYCDCEVALNVCLPSCASQEEDEQDHLDQEESD